MAGMDALISRRDGTETQAAVVMFYSSRQHSNSSQHHLMHALLGSIYLSILSA